MSGQFPYQGGVPPSTGTGPAQPMFNGAGPRGPMQNYGPPQGNKGMPNGPPFGNAPMRAPFPSQSGPPPGNGMPMQPRNMNVPPSSSANVPPNRFQGPHPPTSQFDNMNLNDPANAGMRPPGPPQGYLSNQTIPPQPAPGPGHPAGMRPPMTTGSAHPRSMAPGPNMMPPSSNMPPGPGAGPQPRPMGPPPTSMGHLPTSMGHPPTSMGHPPTSMGHPPTSMGHQPTNMGPPPTSMGHQPTNMGPPPTSMGHQPTNMGPPPTSMGHQPTNMGPPPTSMGHQPTNMGHPPLSGMAPPPHGAGGSALPPSSMGAPPGHQPTMQPPPSSSYPGGMMPPPQSSSAPLTQQPPMAGQYGMPPTGMVPPHGQGMHPPPPQGMHPPPPQGMHATPSHGMPGNQFPGSAPYGGSAPQPAPQRKLDPDQMPSPIQVIEDDRRNRSGVFCTDSKGLVPPLVSTNFITQDRGNVNPRFMRSTMYNIPCTADMIKSSHIPFALAVTPFAELGSQEQAPPLVDLGELGPVRCKRCKAYMNPFMQFIDGGRRFQCVFCGAATDVPSEYFAHLDHTGKRVDCFNRAELCLGSYEFAATKDYCKNGVPPKEPAFIFMIEVSYNSVKSGLVQLICERLKSDILVNLPKETGVAESEIRVGFVTYHKEIHFYNVKSALAQPQMMVVSDIDDMFVPLVDGFLVKLSESEAIIDSLLSQIPQLFSESKETELVLGPVIQAGLDALKSSERAGRLYIFHTGLPTAEAPGQLKNRDDRKLLGTEKEKTILSPQTTFYNKLGADCVAAGCSVDLFLFPNQYVDIASIADICRVTSGNIFKYSYFQADLDGDRFLEDLKHTVMRSQAFDAILRIRTSTGIRPVDFLGNFFMANTTDVEMASVDSDSTVAVEIKHDDKLTEAEGSYIQVAVLYTNISGQRRLRCHNLSLNCCAQMADLFRSCELDVLVNFFAKQAIRMNLNGNPKQVREHIMNEVSQILACYRRNCANPSSAGQLVLPECMKLLPLYSNCIIRSDSISGGSEISTDDRSYLMHLVNAMDVKTSNVFFYPRLLSFHNVEMESSEIPMAIRCSIERLEDSGIYILENGLSMFLWIGHSVNPDLIQKIFGVQSAAQVDIDKVQVMHLDNPVSRRLNELIAKLREERSRYLKLTIVRQRDKLQPWFDHFLVEDKGSNAGSSYVDFLCHIHKEIRNILN